MYGGFGGGMPQITQDMMIPGLPYRPPFTPDIPVREHMQQYLQIVNGSLMHEIQQKAQTNPLRQALFWRMSANWFANGEYSEMLKETMGYAEVLMTQAPPQQAIEKAASDMCSMYAAKEAQANPGLQGMLDEAGMRNVQDWLARYQEVGQNVMAFMNQHPAPIAGQGGGYGGGYGNVPPGNGMQHSAMPHGPMTNQMGGHPMQGGHYPPNSAPPGYGHGYDPHAGYQPPGGYPPMDTRRGPTMDPRHQRGPGNRSSPHAAAGMWVDSHQHNHNFGENTHTSAFGSSLKPRRQTAPGNPDAEIEPEPSPASQPEPEPEPSPEPVPETTVKTDGGQQPMKVPAPKAQSPLTPMDQPHPYLFDPEREVVFYNITSDSVTEEVVDKAPNMKYEDHETEPFLRPVLKSEDEIERDRNRAADAFQQVVTQENVKEYLRRLNGESPEGEDIDENETDRVKRAIRIPGDSGDEKLLAETADTAPTALLNYCLENNIDRSKLEGHCIVYEYMVFSDYILDGKAAVKFMELQNATDYEILHQRLRELMDTNVPQLVVRMLVDGLTDHINTILTVEMGLEYTIDSFMIDIHDLRSVLGQRMGSRILEIFDSSCPRVAKQNFAYVIGVEGEEGDEKTGKEDRIVPVKNGINVQLTMESQDFMAAAFGDHAAIRESRFPELYSAVEWMLSIRDEEDRYVRFITADGNVLNLHKSLMGDALLISK